MPEVQDLHTLQKTNNSYSQGTTFLRKRQARKNRYLDLVMSHLQGMNQPSTAVPPEPKVDASSVKLSDAGLASREKLFSEGLTLDIFSNNNRAR